MSLHLVPFSVIFYYTVIWVIFKAVAKLSKYKGDWSYFSKKAWSINLLFTLLAMIAQILAAGLGVQSLQ